MNEARQDAPRESVWNKLIPFWEGVLYSPVFVFPLAVLAQPHLARIEGLEWLSSQIESKHAYAIVMLAVGIWFIVEPLLQGFWYVFAGVTGSERIEQVGRTLIANIARHQDIREQLAVLQTWVDEWNVDWSHFEARLWFWLGARYLQDAQLERQIESSLHDYIASIGRKKQTYAYFRRYLAWHLRTAAKLGSASQGLVPPQLQFPDQKGLTD